MCLHHEHHVLFLFLCHSNIAVHCDIMNSDHIDVITHCDVTMGTPGNDMVYCDVIMGHRP